MAGAPCNKVGRRHDHVFFIDNAPYVAQAALNDHQYASDERRGKSAHEIEPRHQTELYGTSVVRGVLDMRVQ